MRLLRISYEDMKEYGKDYRLILHKDQLYYALIDNDGGHLAVCEVIVKQKEIHINCLYVPEYHRGHGYAVELIKLILMLYNEYAATAQANDWSIKTFLRCGFHVKSKKQFKYWMAYYVYKEPANGQ